MLPQNISFKNLSTFLLLISSITLMSQEAFHNFGSVQIHDQGQIGFHVDVINDGDFDQNVGLAGFYNPTQNITVSGTNRPIFHDMEVDVPNDLILEVGVGVNNFQEFINGRVQTPRNDLNVSLDYINDAPYLGANDDRFVDGYASTTGVLDFTFPVGDDFRLRPMRVENNAAVNTAKGAYFFENPNSPNYFSGSFDTNNFGDLLFGISIFEFWDLNGDVETSVTLTWDDNSNIPTLVDDLSDLRVVGWDENLGQWVNLGNISTTGDLNNGEITSLPFVPDNYVVLTFGTSSSLLDGDLEIFTAISPNDDGLNDTFIIQGLAQFPDNEVFIYNRWGVLVYQQDKYHEVQDTSRGFRGVSEGRVTIAKNEELPVGTYYYILKIRGEKDRAGYVYINR
ncbi:gliding motility-associated C-terminal domain-containing protein [Aquimarina sp. 2201CG5-10]|uniref:gliding motility-associated C-terminal domain-containing protein n=1 Tax=Aquimarina callyspongiae TaxID=3098150 RepID=UPI002AB581C9|nr:gliding motility-associated C-terminal domain-containing protein [Aquimarina sp. 2201CG5-10]MDY8138781.1 gliding motility-associated C-terminal domain-containing protein [Aquimarina sp. 2201CG5-10]